MENILAEEKLGFGELFSFSWKVFKNRFWAIVLIVLLLQVSFSVVISSIPQENLTLLIVVNVLSFLAGTLANLGVIFLVDACIKSEDMEVFTALNLGLRRFFSAFGAVFLAWLVIGLNVGLVWMLDSYFFDVIQYGWLFMLLLLPGMTLSFYLLFVTQVVALEKANPIQAIRESFQLIKGRFWKTLGKVILLVLVFMLVFMGLGIFVTLLAIGNKLLMDMVIIILTLVASSFFIVFFTVLYLNLKAFKSSSN